MVASRIGRMQRWAWLCVLIWASLTALFGARFHESPWLLGLGILMTLLMGSVAILHPFEELPWKVALRGVVVLGSLMILTPIELWPWLTSALVGTWILDVYTLSKRTEERASEPSLNPPRDPRALLIVGVAAVSFALALVPQGGLTRTAALFIGLPTLLGLIVVYSGSPMSLTGTILRATTLGLVIASILLPEGFIFILMAAPLFYGIGALVGLTVEKGRVERC